MRHTYLSQSVFVAAAGLPVVPGALRHRLLRGAGVRTSTPSLIHRGVVVQGLGRLTLGSGVFVNYGCFFDTVADITVGDRVFLADHVRVLTSSHHTGPSEQRAGPLTGEPVHIGGGAWIGSGAVILPGVTIGAGAVIGANSLVTADCAPNALYVGSPARRRRNLP
ncbi:acetyltransferase [Rhodococcus sp. HNM0563]|uniref:DapH/DapD/GlmU-related protein n=1 Tax=unclassified Rhodococcus (in: high G+C Gram-positive bacteria) TaxID=192944 RepID=UPI00146DEBE3|nr:DapH/DapD/GlmU-related protein [Rhodococcus sp. F64268]MCK0093515.1 acetyltransferase [Rhodococcus sp. F64268]NLU64773.1 acetyltransferase [Rhodococcus sp. HNM0563]